MYKFTHFDKKLCRFLRHKFDLAVDDCDVYSIWHFCPGTRWRAIKNFLLESSLCQAEWFPVIFWVVLAISTLGSFYSLSEFTSLYWGGRKRVSMWRSRKYYVIPYSVLRKCRLVGSLVMLNAWLLLWYAVINVSPGHMTPWLTINMFVLSFELMAWLVEVLVGATKLDLHTLFTFCLPVANYLFVRCVRNVFQNAIETNDVDDLRLWKRGFK
ncbi:uncharacterized protein LOC120778629 isoform X2 [Bactrocera tryoni]|uniref:uncharacterized protein LOC120778629 isoform X2 n=1 Tax=Bactrocera tryoni TaxID=59916 RepID=UPI001A97F4C7|nr:uncharacterized protein LOC120778629 isoform X2 [Bactrocera tryoni]